MLVLATSPFPDAHAAGPALRLNHKGYFETRGLNVLVFSNWYNGLFSDSKISGVELIHHEVRTATNGDVRLSPTPEQWDPIPELVKRSLGADGRSVEAQLTYRDHGFDYTIRAEAQGGGIVLAVALPNPLPKALEGRAGFNLEFLRDRVRRPANEAVPHRRGRFRSGVVAERGLPCVARRYRKHPSSYFAPGLYSATLSTTCEPATKRSSQPSLSKSRNAARAFKG